MDRYIVISIGVMAVIALVTVGMGSEMSHSCEQAGPIRRQVEMLNTALEMQTRAEVLQ